MVYISKYINNPIDLLVEYKTYHQQQPVVTSSTMLSYFSIYLLIMLTFVELCAFMVFIISRLNSNILEEEEEEEEEMDLYKCRSCEMKRKRRIGSVKRNRSSKPAVKTLKSKNLEQKSCKKLQNCLHRRIRSSSISSKSD